MLKQLKKTTICIACFLATFINFAQTENLNFEFGNLDHWILDTGQRINTTDIDWNPRPADDLGIQIELTSPSSTLFDEIGLKCFPTPINITTVFPNGQFSARIGNIEGDNKVARLSRKFIVSADETLLQYSYAIVLEDPNHKQEEQPKFVVNIKDTTGNILDCGQFEVFAGPNADDKGFVNCGKYQLLPWTTGGADLTPFIGQQITIEFIALDCTLGEHGGYAYVEASLQPLKIKVEDFCINGDTVTLSAPVGFDEYSWSNGDETRSITVTNVQFGDTFSVDLFSNTGCLSSISVRLQPVPRATINSIPDEEVCLGGSTLLQPTGENVGDFRYTRPDPTNPGGFVDAAPNGLSAILNPTQETTYTVIARDENGCDGPSTNFTIGVITSDEPPFPSADFKIEPRINSGKNPCNTIQLVNLSGYCKGGLTYLWDFGDGTTSREVNPIHTFPITNDYKTYVITLNVIAADGLTDSKSLEHGSSITAQFSKSPPECETVTVNNTSTICGASITNFPSFVYTWNFGDGSPNVTTKNTELSVMHDYTASGVYTITLTITNPDNPSLNVPIFSDTVDITIETIIDFNFTIDCFDVIFEDISKTCKPIVNYSWDFGDGSPISNRVITKHTYTAAGTYPITLTINDGTQNLSQMYNVTINPNATIPKFDFDLNCTMVRFTDLTNSCSNLTYQWDFGDGSDLSNEQNPIHTYVPDNTYNVTLMLYDGIDYFSITKSVSLTSQYLYEPPRDLIVCATSDMPGKAIFDLAVQRDYILQNIDITVPEVPVVSFHLTSNDAFTNFNALPLEFTNITNPQTLYARIEDSNGCLLNVPFLLTVYDTPTVNTIDDIFLCYLKENAVGYDLSQLNARFFDDIDQSNINLSYYLFEDDAIQGLNNVTQINLNAGLDITIYVRAENDVYNTCYSITQFLIRMNNEDTDTNNRCMPFFANTMTPNGDGVNDAFFIKNIERFPNNKLTIYNRWGNIVYETTNYNNTWHGTHKGEPLPVGNYYYYMELNDNENRSHSGYITILR